MFPDGVMYSHFPKNKGGENMFPDGVMYSHFPQKYRNCMRFFLLTLIFFGIINAQTWSGLRTYGGSNVDYLERVDFYAPGNSIIFNFLLSGSYKVDNTSGSDFVVIRTNPYGSSIWERVIGVSNLNDWSYRFDYDNNGNIVIVGISCTPNAGSYIYCSNLPSSTNEGFIIKLSNNDGSVIVAKRLHDNWGDPTINNWLRVLSIETTNDGGFVIGGEIKYERYNNNVWISTTQGFVAKLDQNMNLTWIRAVGDTMNNVLAYRVINSVFQSSDGNIIAYGTSQNNIWIGKFNISNGNLIWQKVYNRSRNIHRLSWAKLTSDGGIIIADHIDGGVSNSDVLFLKLDQNGNLICARQFGSLNYDFGIDVEEGSNYYYITGGLNYDNSLAYGNLFYAKINKTNCSLITIRYLLPISTEGRGITVKGGIAYTIGWINNSNFSNGNWDGILAADSGIQDTCYWRTFIPNVNQNISLSNGTNWNLYNNVLVSISNQNYNFLNVNVSKKVACGLLTPLNNSEDYQDCEISIINQEKFIRIVSKLNSLKVLSVYKIDGRLVYKTEFYQNNFELKLEKGIYVLRLEYDKKTIERKVFIRR
jgi:hypothetical protein